MGPRAVTEKKRWGTWIRQSVLLVAVFGLWFVLAGLRGLAPRVPKRAGLVFSLFVIPLVIAVWLTFGISTWVGGLAFAPLGAWAGGVVWMRWSERQIAQSGSTSV